MSRLEDRYGSGPLHLIATVVGLAIVAYALLEVADRPGPVSFAVFFGGAILAHDLIAFPVYSLLGTIAGRAADLGGDAGRLALNYVRVPAILSGLLLLVFFPLILRLDGEVYALASGHSANPYLARWLLVSAGMFAVSGVLLALRLRRAPS